MDLAVSSPVNRMYPEEVMLTPVSGEFHDLQCFHAAGQIHIRGSRSPGGMTAD